MTATPQDVLNCTMDPETNDAKAGSVREYLAALLTAVWDENEGFSGKRPFGNSGWTWEVYAALVHGGILPGTFDEDGYLEEIDDRAADSLVRAAITAMGASA
jgi:hypothetical protein